MAAEDPKLVHVTTVPMSLRFFRGQISYLKERGFSVEVASSPAEALDEFAAEQGVTAHAVEMPRRITPVRDAVAIVELFRLFRRLRPEIVHAHTPKAGVLAMIASWLARVPLRMYHIHGLPHITAQGWKRTLLRATEQISCTLAHEVFCVSESIRKVACNERIVGSAEATVLAKGSINGVDACGWFDPDNFPRAERVRIRAELGVGEQAPVVGFVGRIVRDKGIEELAEAWSVLRSEFPSAHLLLVGPYESQDPISPSTEERLRLDPRVHPIGYLDNPAPVMAVMDVLALPSHREGFGLVALEANALQIPVVATSIPGCVDAVVDGVTGTLIPARDARALTNALRRYLLDSELRHAHGSAGRERALADFQPESIWSALYEAYRLQLARIGVVPRGERALAPAA